MIPFIQATQPDEWAALTAIHKDQTETVLIDDLCRALDREGMLTILRHGFKCYGKRIHVAFFAPASSMNPDTKARYEANRLTVVRQLKYSPDCENSIDVALFVNGLPVATLELKNPMTGQNVNHAKHQYRQDRNPKKDPKATLLKFKKRALVHFAVDPDEAWMTTKLAGKSTYFLPFNKGRDGGAGNPDNPGNYRTAYLWEEVLERHSFMDIPGPLPPPGGQGKERRQGQEVHEGNDDLPALSPVGCGAVALHASQTDGPGTNYLIQHSAGSGKSNSIAWLAHRLASLHDSDDKRVFDSVGGHHRPACAGPSASEHHLSVLSTSRVWWKRIDQDSTQLANALKAKTPIIITTLQKFPFVTEKIGELPKQTYPPRPEVGSGKPFMMQ